MDDDLRRDAIIARLEQRLAKQRHDLARQEAKIEQLEAAVNRLLSGQYPGSEVINLKMETLADSLKRLETALEKVLKSMKEELVSQKDFWPVKSIVVSAAVTILGTVLTAVLSLVVWPIAKQTLLK